MKKLSLFLIIALILGLCSCTHTHQYTPKVVAPTCTADGYTDFICSCGNRYQSNITAAGHTEQQLPAKDATCLLDGLTEGKVCSACGAVLSPQESINATGHTYGDWTIAKQPTLTEPGQKVKQCAACGDQLSEEIPKLDDPGDEEYKVEYALEGGHFLGEYASIEELGDEFLADFNKYGDAAAAKETFQADSTAAVKVALANPEMLEKWNSLWVYMLQHLREYNEGKNSSYITDTYPILERMIRGDTTAIGVSPNARTSIRSYIHGVLNSMKGCGDENATFAAFSPDFSSSAVQEEFLKHQYNLTATLANGEALPQPIKEGYEFVGWENKYGEIISTASCHGILIARWKEVNPVEKIQITNKISEIGVLETYRLTWKIEPENAGNTGVHFVSDNPAVAEIDENGSITAHSVGEVTFRIISESEKGYEDTLTVQVITPGYFDISYETTSYVAVGGEIGLHAAYINRAGQSRDVEWSSLDQTLATVNEDGRVTGKATGMATIRAAVKGDTEKYQDFIVTVLPQDISQGLQLVLDAHESNVFIKHQLPIGAGTPNYYSDIFGSVSRLLYNHELMIDTTYHQKTNEKYGSSLPNRVMESIEFITVHYTAGFNKDANGRAHGEWFAQPLSENDTSIHYSTGNDGVFKGLDEQYRAAHAGDGGSLDTLARFSWIDTPVEVLDSDPEFPIVTITQDATFAINGRDTGVKIPKETRYGRGYVTDSKWLNAQGIAVNIKDGKYQIGTSWWCYTQVLEGRICSNGGNYNSIGIESAVNKGSDLWYTWQITAQLVADIMQRHGLDITKVKGHHFFSAKNCPQPMLENDMEIWWEFIDLVKAEYEKITTCQDYTFTFESDSSLVNEHGRISAQDNHAQVVTYRVMVEKDGVIETIELASVVEGRYAQMD